MQVAEILSDLTSLRVCDHNDALALVSVGKNIPLTQPDPKVLAEGGFPEETKEQQQQTQDSQGQDHNRDLQRAKELVNLHYAIKEKHRHGTVDEDLARARSDVDRVLRELNALKRRV